MNWPDTLPPYSCWRTSQSSGGIVGNIFKCKLPWHPTPIPSNVVGIFDLLYHCWQGHRPVRPAVWYFNWSVQAPGRGRWSEVKGVNVVQWPAPPTARKGPRASHQRGRPQVSPLWWGLLSIIPLHTWLTGTCHLLGLSNNVLGILYTKD